MSQGKTCVDHSSLGGFGVSVAAWAYAKKKEDAIS